MALDLADHAQLSCRRPTRLARRNDFVFGRPPPRGSVSHSHLLPSEISSGSQSAAPISSISRQSTPPNICIRHVSELQEYSCRCSVSHMCAAGAKRLVLVVQRRSRGDLLIRVRPIKASDRYHRSRRFTPTRFRASVGLHRNAQQPVFHAFDVGLPPGHRGAHEARLSAVESANET